MACSTDPGSSLLLISPPQLPGVLLWAHTHLPNIPDTIAVKDFRPDYTKTAVCKDFPGDPVVETLPSSAGAAGSIPGQGTKIPHAL